MVNFLLFLNCNSLFITV